MNKKSIVLGILAALVVVAGGAALIVKVNADTVAVSATVATTVTCSASATSTSFGTLTTSAVGTATPNVTVSLACNSGAGCTLQVLDAGHGGTAGLYNSTSPGHLIQSTNATLAAGTEGYGIQGAIGVAATGGALTVNPVYAVTGNQVGGLSTTALTLASSSAPTTGGTIVVTHEAAISNLTAAGTYTDTITYQCTGN